MSGSQIPSQVLLKRVRAAAILLAVREVLQADTQIRWISTDGVQQAWAAAGDIVNRANPTSLALLQAWARRGPLPVRSAPTARNRPATVLCVRFGKCEVVVL
uniref:Uncharacterized protein n=1 Tax=Eutreptiella gymnastica TaxID=73025 RepID=A0A7S4G2S8_9EUGL